MLLQYAMRIVPAILLLLAGLLIAGDRDSKRRIVGFLASFGMANDESDESIEASANVLVKVMYALSFVFFVWFGFFYYKQHRVLKPQPMENPKLAPATKIPSPALPKTPAATTEPAPEGETTEPPKLPAPKQFEPQRPATTTRLPGQPALAGIRFARAHTGECGPPG